MSRITDCVNTDLPLYADDPRCSALIQNEEILKAIALLEANRFQVHFQPGVDIVGSLNYNIKWVSELLSEKKELQKQQDKNNLLISLLAHTLKGYGKDVFEMIEDEDDEAWKHEVGWKCVECGNKSEDEMFAYHEVKYHKDFGTLCLECYAEQEYQERVVAD